MGSFDFQISANNFNLAIVEQISLKMIFFNFSSFELITGRRSKHTAGNLDYLTLAWRGSGEFWLLKRRSAGVSCGSISSSKKAQVECSSKPHGRRIKIVGSLLSWQAPVQAEGKINCKDGHKTTEAHGQPELESGV